MIGAGLAKRGSAAHGTELTRIYVLPDRQHSGIGTQLLEARLAAFAQQGFTRLTVLVERDNILGRRFYEKMGFAERREVSQKVHGYVLKLLECDRPTA